MGDKNATESILADAAGIARAAEILRSGGLVAVPTETVYGLAARADNEEAVAKIYAAKGRPSFNPLIVHVRDAEHARSYANLTGSASWLAELEWPGPLTLVVPLNPDAGLADAVSAGLPTVALRAPAHPVMRALLEICEFPLAAPSANRSGFISPTSASHVAASLDERIDLILDAGPCEKGLESTILAVREDGSWEELRPGPVDLDALHRHYFDRGLERGASGNSIEAPGQLASHYAPGKPVRLNAERAEADEFHIGFGAVAGDCSLSVSGNLAEAGSNLYACLHEATGSDLPRIAVAPIADTGLGKAINDRLRRASA
ncbi:L-threonylcarbamoyladenylate synthase [Pontixanthobacter gangjinensis]|uniref:Threonylcarbamoyl-AMP synthase n=1 Tax=Pontixanthobacter gangjinensis TaxID=1028742 RepID=A0A6I4SLK9_9SPHN|nr:L-threonylcarbamoyladenylate synthase [Pontixanthobacter gangjinensis]MXO55682.1 threonylcarbamoyl-AMP synthase [Pontixanthobacter gangjinensis]